jgi:hypothetical protein
VLAQGELPEEFVRGVAEAEEELAWRRARLDLADDDLAGTVPRLAPDARISSRPVLGEGEFTWGHVLVSDRRPEGVECSAAVADLLRGIDGRRSVAAVVNGVTARYPAPAREGLRANLLFALRTLCVEGAIDQLVKPDGTEVVGPRRS